MTGDSGRQNSSNNSSRLRSILAVVLVILTAVSLVATLTAYWNRSVVLDTDAWMEVVEPVIGSEALNDELSRTLANGVLEMVGLEQLLDQAIEQVPDLGPVTQQVIDLLGIPSLAELSDRLVDGVRVRLENAISGLLRSETVQDSVTELVRRAHQAFVALATDNADDLEALYVEGDTLKLNTLPLLVEVTQRVIEEGLVGWDIDLRLPDLSDYPVASVAIALIASAVDFEIPDDLGQLDVMTVDQLETLQSAARTLNRLAWLLSITTLALLVASLYVSPRPRRTTVQLAVAVLVALVASYLLIQALISRLQGWFVGLTASAFEQVSREISASIAGVWIAVAVLGVLVGATAFIAGLPQVSRRSGRGEASTS